MPYAHFTQEEREGLQDLLNRRLKCREIACRLDKDPTSVSREVKRNRKADGRRHGHAKPSTLCSKFRGCEVGGLCGKCSGKACATCSKADCAKICDGFDKMVCRSITRFPYVCNGCAKRSTCRLERFSYSASVAQAKAADNASEPRRGVDLTGRQLSDLDALVTPLMMRDQSLNQIYMAHGEEIPCSLKSLYTHVNKGEVGPGRMHLVDAVARKPRKKNEEKDAKPIPRKTLAGRGWEDYLALDEDDRDGRWEMDTVIGRVGGACLLTLLHRPTRFQLALLLERCASAEVIAALKLVASAMGERISKAIYMILTDNGSEFFDAEGVEAACKCRLYYCESYSSWQKGAAECNHKFYRRIAPKGTSFDSFTAHDCALMMSHVNSTPRPCLGGISPIEAVAPIVGQDLLDALGIELVPRDEVVLKPYLINR
ncbi:IS30 family transposase [Eggerthella lenta]|jgi:transposase, IS30 family|uniref:IS30 family transposase n=1 Tax=Eggerthella lenta TaxID=84112 RepID=UPI00189B4ECA|nr:IS30 family transposase [Eggerthella lenta]MDB1807408.1 IS30 family transposase [Eggerthella lenta]